MNTGAKTRLNPWREITVLMVIFMEASWITPWFRSLTPQTYAIGPWQVLLVFGTIVVFSYFLSRAMDYLMLKRNIRRFLTVILIIVWSYLGLKVLLYSQETVPLFDFLLRPLRSFTDLMVLIPIEFIIILTVLFSFWRGISLAHENIGPSVIMTHFWIGILMFVGFIFLITIVTGESAGDFFFLFLFATLLGVSAARMTVIGLVRGGREVSFDRPWFLGIALAALTVAAIGFYLGTFIGINLTGLGTLILGLFGSIVVLVWIILNPLLTLLISFISKLFSNSQLVMDLVNNLKNLNELIGRLGQTMRDKLETTGINAFFAGLAPILKLIVLSGILVIIAAAIVTWITIRLRIEREKRFDVQEQKETLLPDNLIQALLDKLMKRFSRVRGSVIQFLDVRHRQRLRAAARIRQIYADALDMCERLDLPRPEAYTPLEFEPKILTIFPEYWMEVSTLTQAYIKVRYGLLPETQNELVDIEAAWKRLYAAGQSLLQLKKNLN